MGNNFAILKKDTANISKEKKKVELYKNDNNIFHSKIGKTKYVKS